MKPGGTQVSTFAALAFAFTPLSAQNGPAAPAQAVPGDPDAIIVQGERELGRDEVIDTVRDIAMRGRTLDRPLEKFREPICVKVAGLGDRIGAMIANRIQANAMAAGHKIGEPDCKSNAAVIFVDGSERLIERMRDEYPTLFSAEASRRIQSALDRREPVVSWNLFEIRERDGSKVGQAGGIPGGGVIFGNGTAVPTTRSFNPSRTEVKFSLARTNAVIVFEAAPISGYSTTQLADFATVWLIGDPQPDVELGVSGARSILGMFKTTPEAAPQALSRLDRAYLKALSNMRPNEASARLEQFVREAYENLDEDACGADCPAKDMPKAP